MEGIVILENYRPKKIGFFEKRRAKKSIRHFENALAIFPEHFPSLFFIGKIYQRFGEYEKALLYFEKALEIEKENYNLPQEASLVAMDLNLIDKAIEYSNEALQRSPNNFALMGNHAMNLLIAGEDEIAKEIIEKAVKLEPNDSINKNIQNKINAVISKEIKRPTFKDSI
ncbi:tetratricopeptide repeat protein [Flavobacterium pectinovorum]|nr:tetratricopeptide repeat protein [Flavobacterium pectinovorum]